MAYDSDSEDSSIPPADHANHSGGSAGSLEGCRLYSPFAVAGYAVLMNAPLALALVGLNARKQGHRMAGALVLLIAALGGVALLSPTDGAGLSTPSVWTSPAGIKILAQTQLSGRPPTDWQLLRLLFSVACAYILYRIEKPRYLQALAKGAVRARWWIPLVWLLVFLVLIAKLP